MPSGAGDIQVGLRIVLGMMKAQAGKPFHALVVLPLPLLRNATSVYRQYAGPDVQVVNVMRTSEGVRLLGSSLAAHHNTTIIIAGYEDMQRVGMAQVNAKAGPVDLLLLEMAHIVRAGGFREAGVTNDIVSAKQRVFISSRHLAGLAPGALLAPGQEQGYPEEEPQTAFGHESYRLSHTDTENMMATVPLRLAFLKSARVADVAVELMRVHESLGVRSFAVVPHQPRLTKALNELLGNLSQGACTATATIDADSVEIDAVLVAGSNPDYVAIAQEFSRLARRAPHKQHGYILVTAAAKTHVVAAWRALAIERQETEEAMQRAAVEQGNADRWLTWEEIPYELRSFIDPESDRQDAILAVARGVNFLADPWDLWLGRLAAYREKFGILNIDKKSRNKGHEVGNWVQEQREVWERGQLASHKISRLKAMGLMLDLQAETFALGLAELRKYVARTKSRIVPFSYTTKEGFPLGKWVIDQRTKQRRGRLSYKHQEMLKSAFFVWRPSEPNMLAAHPSDPEAAEITMQLEEELRKARWLPIGERRRAFRSLVLKHHPDVSDDKHASTTIQFLADVKDWFLAGY